MYILGKPALNLLCIGIIVNKGLFLLMQEWKQLFENVLVAYWRSCHSPNCLRRHSTSENRRVALTVTFTVEREPSNELKPVRKHALNCAFIIIRN